MIWELAKILFHVFMVVMAQGLIFAGLLHLWIHCSPAMSVWTGIAGMTLLVYCGGYRVFAWGWGFGDRGR